MKPDISSFKTSRISFVVILLIHLLFFASAQLNHPVPLSDSADYLKASENIYSQGVLYCGDLSEPIREENFTRRPPLYPLLLGTVKLTGSKLPAILIQILISMASIFLVFRMFLQNHNPVKTQKLPLIFATLLLLATPAQFIYSNLIMAEILFQFLMVLMAWSIYSYFKNRESRYIWFFNLFLTLGMATKPVLFPFAVLCMVISLVFFLRTKKPALILAIFLPVIWITGYCIWNYNRTGSAQYSSIQTANLVNYNLRYFLMEQEGSEFAAAEVDRLYGLCGEETEYREKNKCLGKGVREIVFDRPFQYGIFHIKGSMRYFIDPGRFDLVSFFKLEEPDSPGILLLLNQEGIGGVFKFLKQQGLALISILVFIVLVKLIKITGFILFLLRGREQLPFRIFLAILVVYFALVTGPLGASRFLLPIELFLIGGAVLGWSSLKLKNLKYFRKVG